MRWRERPPLRNRPREPAPASRPGEPEGRPSAVIGDAPSSPNPLEVRLAAAEQRLAALSEGRSLCDLSRAGAPGGVKEAEGRMFALVELRQRGPGAAAEVLASWERELASAQAGGAAWRAYRAGGVDELRSLLADLQADHLSQEP